MTDNSNVADCPAATEARCGCASDPTPQDKAAAGQRPEEQAGHCAPMDISKAADCTETGPGECAGDTPSLRVWDRDSASGPPTLTDDQRRAHESASEQLSIANEIVAEGTSDFEDPRAEREVASHAESPFLDGVLLSTDVDAGTEHQDVPPVGRARWWAWTAALLSANGALGAFETLVGRLGGATVRALSGHPNSARDLDTAMAAHAAVNLALGLVAAARAGLHVWRGRGDPEAYGAGFRGRRNRRPLRWREPLPCPQVRSRVSCSA
ncbi:hypothetical protein FBZ93_12269 [Bradyrhizobium macuxiense]|uniref:Uncharacterized protein n=1 Tax=Bradyrhizobium macuxiense TaxID=1755647 RepID=A0A560KVK9_9BRAD|nr:hypothetical protein FBZ93_12269 [Bradyrhizobium macuxiense]